MPEGQTSRKRGDTWYLILTLVVNCITHILLVPLMALIDYRGFRLVAMSLLPIKVEDYILHTYIFTTLSSNKGRGDNSVWFRRWWTQNAQEECSIQREHREDSTTSVPQAPHGLQWPGLDIHPYR